MKFGLNGLRSWDRSIWIIPGRESIDASKKIFLFNLVVPWWNDERIFLLRIHANYRESLLFSRRREKKKKKKRRVNWRMQFWRNSLGVNCSILHNSNNSTNELHYYVDMGFHGIVHYGEGGEFLRYLRFRDANPPRSIIANVINRFDRRRYAFREIVEEIVARIRLQFVFERRKQRSLQ